MPLKVRQSHHALLKRIRVVHRTYFQYVLVIQSWQWRSPLSRTWDHKFLHGVYFRQNYIPGKSRGSLIRSLGHLGVGIAVVTVLFWSMIPKREKIGPGLTFQIRPEPWEDPPRTGRVPEKMCKSCNLHLCTLVACTVDSCRFILPLLGWLHWI